LRKSVSNRATLGYKVYCRRRVTLTRFLILCAETTLARKLMQNQGIFVQSPGDRRGFIGLVRDWWQTCPSDPSCPLKLDCGHHLPVSVFHDLTRFEYGLVTLPNCGVERVAGPLYVLTDHFNQQIKKTGDQPYHCQKTDRRVQRPLYQIASDCRAQRTPMPHHW
jgi:hypothetical protein